MKKIAELKWALEWNTKFSKAEIQNGQETPSKLLNISDYYRNIDLSYL